MTQPPIISAVIVIALLHLVCCDTCKNTPKVAVLFTGQVRSFRTTHPSIKENLLDGLAPGCPGNIHVFLHPSEDQPSSFEINLNAESRVHDEGKEEGLSPPSPSPSEGEDILKTLRSYFEQDSGTRYTVYYGAGIFNTAPVPNRCSSYPSNTTYMQYQSQVTLFNKIPTLIENRFGDKTGSNDKIKTKSNADMTMFDYIVRARFDIAFIEKVPPVVTFDVNKFHTNSNHFPISDQFAIVPKSIATKYFNIMDSFL